MTSHLYIRYSYLCALDFWVWGMIVQFQTFTALFAGSSQLE